MKLCIFSIYDSKAEAFIQPFFSPNPATAIRSFTEAVNDPTTTFAKYPGDYTLFSLGTFDHDTAAFDTGVPANLGLAQTFVESWTDDELPTSITQNIAKKGA